MVGNLQAGQARDNGPFQLYAADNIAAVMLKRESYDMKEPHLEDGGICLYTSDMAASGGTEASGGFLRSGSTGTCNNLISIANMA